MVQKPSIKKALTLVFRFAITLVFLYFVLRYLDLDSLQKTFGRTRFWILSLSVLCLGLSVLLMAMRWKRLLQIDAISPGLGELVRYYFESGFVGLFIPTIVGGDVYRIVRITRRFPNAVHSSVNVSIERIIGLFCLLGLGVAGFAAFSVYDLRPTLRYGIVAGGAGLILLVTFLPSPILSRLAKHISRENRFYAVILQLKNYASNPRLVVALVLLSVLSHLASMASTYFAAVSLGIALNPLFYMTVLPAVWLLGMVPSFGGVGPREGGLVFVLAHAGVSAQTAAAVAVLTLFVRVLWAGVGAVLLVTGNYSFRPKMDKV
ncbi:MAG: flippase-like domain-containing protein [Myxococcales bacterium]|nr:MAG: flippase-like domain-containing protein [Myxococcales bacterium]